MGCFATSWHRSFLIRLVTRVKTKSRRIGAFDDHSRWRRRHCSAHNQYVKNATVIAYLSLSVLCHDRQPSRPWTSRGEHVQDSRPTIATRNRAPRRHPYNPMERTKGPLPDSFCKTPAAETPAWLHDSTDSRNASTVSNRRLEGSDPYRARIFMMIGVPQQECRNGNLDLSRLAG